jgi:hypothetical protein
MVSPGKHVQTLEAVPILQRRTLDAGPRNDSKAFAIDGTDITREPPIIEEPLHHLHHLHGGCRHRDGLLEVGDDND